MITVPLDELRICLSCLITFETLGSVTHFVLVISVFLFIFVAAKKWSIYCGGFHDQKRGFACGKSYYNSR